MTSDDEGPQIRRVVTGQAKGGASVLASDTAVSPVETALLPGAKFYSLWGADSPLCLPNDGTEPDPPDGGFRFELIVLPPDGTPREPGLDMKQALAEREKALPGLIGKMDPAHPGMHQTDSVDLIYVTRGACVLKLDGGRKIALTSGDVIVQNGPRHAWHNPHTEPCGLLTISLGVRREG